MNRKSPASASTTRLARRRFAAAAGILAVACVLQAATSRADDAVSARDRTIVPGKRVGAIRPHMQAADIARIFGAGNVKRTRVHVGEGEFVNGVTVLPGTADKITIQWTEDGKRIEFVRIGPGRSAWRTAGGIAIGTPASRLEALNGRPFMLTGFGWDYAGRVVGWRGGRLAKSGAGLILEMAPTRRVPPAEERQVLGDRRFSSDHPVMRRKRLVVRSMLVRLTARK